MATVNVAAFSTGDWVPVDLSPILGGFPGSSIAERCRRLISVADPAFREELEGKAREIGYL